MFCFHRQKTSQAAFLAAALALCQMLFVGLSSYVLCLGPDGSVSLEHSQDGLSCAPRTAGPVSVNIPGLDCAVAVEDSNPCGSCVDIPLSAGDVVQKIGRQAVDSSSQRTTVVAPSAGSPAFPLLAGNARTGLSGSAESLAAPPSISTVVLLL